MITIRTRGTPMPLVSKNLQLCNHGGFQDNNLKECALCSPFSTPRDAELILKPQFIIHDTLAPDSFSLQGDVGVTSGVSALIS